MRETSSIDAFSRNSEARGDIETTRGEENVFGTTGPATSYFSASGYRQYQRETIDGIEDAFDRGKRIVIVEGPTGSGKSHIANAFARQSNSCHLITAQKILQDQYERDFPGMFSMKGRAAYSCTMGDMNDSCMTGPCRRRKGYSNPNCPYRVAKGRARAAPITVHNFDSFYYQSSYGGGFAGRKLLIVDEAHNLAPKFTNFLSFTIHSQGGVVVPEAPRLVDYDAFVQATKNDYQASYEALQRQYDAVGELSREDQYRMDELGKTLHKMRFYLSEREKDHPAEFVFDYKALGTYGPSVTFRPVFVGKFAARWLYHYGERVILMSATILDKEMFCREVGVDTDDAHFVQIPSTFPAKNRAIIKKFAGRMGYKYIDTTLPRIVELVEEIVSKYPDRKGIVQTHSERIANYLQRNLLDRRFTYNKDFPTPKAMLEAHKRKPGSIIVASGLREGVDLVGELSQIQIFCKIPYPSISDKVVARKMDIDPSWYGWATTLSFVQMLGRSVRSPTDKAVTYLLDSGFGYFYKKNSRFIPDYVKDAIRR